MRRGFLQPRHQALLVGGDFVDRLEVGVYFNANVFLAEVTDVAIARHDFEIFAEKLFDGLGLCRRLDYNEVFNHISKQLTGTPRRNCN